MMPPIAVLAGGLATRLRPLTETIPKAMIPVKGEPFAHHLLRLLARNGFEEAVFLIGYKGEDIINSIGNGKKFGINVRYVADGPQLLGTGGALSRASPSLSDTFAVVYGDSWLDFDYQSAFRAFEEDGRPALMTIFRNHGKWDTSNVEYNGQEIIAYSKNNRTPQMSYIDYGFSILKSEVFAEAPADRPFDLSEIFEALARNGQLAGYEVTRRFYEVGSFTGIADLEAHLAGDLS